MRELYEKVKNDPNLLAQVMEILSGAAGEGAEEAQKALLAFAKEQGHEVTIEEMKVFFEGMETSGEMSEGQLDMVAGGKVNPFGIVMSIFSLGVLCAVFSGGSEMIVEGGCKEFFEK